jgi:hypothetical protein
MATPALPVLAATVIDLFFHNVDGESRCVPYIANEEGVEYVCPSFVVGGEGTISFDGYFYVNDAAELTPEEERMQPWDRPSRYGRYLPMELRMVMQRREREPAEREVTPEGWTRCKYTVLEEHDCIINVYKRVTHESTNRVSEIEDDDGEPMSVCFFPTNRQTLYFRIVELPKGTKRVAA